MKRQDVIFLFDVDGTLTPSRCKMEGDVRKMLEDLRKEVFIGFVGGSDLCKQKEQAGEDVLSLFDFGFPENGVSFYKGTELVEKTKIIDKVGEEKYQEIVNFAMKYMSEIILPVKRGTFIEYRDSMINISPIGRSCSKQERKQFKEYDEKFRIRKNMVDVLKKEFGKDNMHFSIGGEISIDCFPVGWDKTYCLRHLKKEGIKRIYFFGDMIHEGGNDYEIFVHPDVKAVQVAGPKETLEKVKEMLENLRDEIKREVLK